MITVLILTFIIYIIFKFITAQNHERKDLKNTPISQKFSEIVSPINAHAYNMGGSIIPLETHSFNLYQEGENQIINFHYSSGILTITWKFKWYNNEVIHKKEYPNVQDIGAEQQHRIAFDMINEMDMVIAKHKAKINTDLFQ